MMETHGCLGHSGLWFLPSDVSVAEHVDLSQLARGLQALRGGGERELFPKICTQMGKWVSKARLSRRRVQALASCLGAVLDLHSGHCQPQIPSLGSSSSKLDAWQVTHHLPHPTHPPVGV